MLTHGVSVRDQIRQRTARNLTQARGLAGRFPSCTLLPVEGGWSLVVRVPALRSEEALTLDLLERAHVLVHPGYFFDFPHEAYIVVSLLPSEDHFVEGFTRALTLAGAA
jgi:aspartate/methionine/tyrosine aminotransferase